MVLAALVGPLLATSDPVGAQTGGGGQQQQLQSQVAQLDQAQSAALASLQSIQQQKASLDARVADLDNQLNAAEASLAPLAAQSADLNGRVAELQVSIAGTQARLDTAQIALNAATASLYRSARSGAQYQTILAAPPQSLVAGGKYLALVTRQRHDLVVQVSALRNQLGRQNQRLLADKAKADAAANDARATRDRIAGLRDQLTPAQAQAASQAATELSALSQIQGNKAQDEAELASLQGASDSIAASLRSRGGGGTAAGACDARPVPGAVTSGFGARGGGFHPGVDMNATYGAPIHACRGGTIVSAGWQGGYGNAVVIDHGGGMATLYAHQSRLAATVGQQVNAGDIIGYVGSTGYSTGPHLHFEVRVNGSPIDPAPYL